MVEKTSVCISAGVFLAVLFLFGGGIFNICLLQISLALIILEILGEKLKLGVAREKGICYNIVGKGI